MIVGEPTANAAVRGHKGALFARAVSRGVTAHSSTPAQGINAIYRAARAIGRLETLDLGPAREPFMGPPTLNVGTIRGGLNANSVPDRAEFTIDVRGGPEPSHAEVMARLCEALGEDVLAEPYIAMPAVLTPADDPFLRLVEACAAASGGPAAKVGSAATYFSDASVFQPLFRCPTVILGPGEPSTAHQTDEWCEVGKIGEAQSIYEAVIAAWCG